MPGPGITAYGVYIPSRRLERAAIAEAHAWALPSLRGLAKGRRSYCDWDEDTITLAVEAARGCLANRGGTPLGSLTLASTTHVFADLQNASFVAGALRLQSLSTQDAGGSLRAGTSALIRAFQAAPATPGASLVVAADNRKARPGSAQEMQFGAGSIAMTVAPDEGIARFLGSESDAAQFVDHFRAEGEAFDYAWEDRWVRDEGYSKIVPGVVGRLLQRLHLEASEIAHFCLASPLRGLSAAVAKRLGLPAESVVDNLVLECGDTGTAHPLIMLAAALERARPGDRILVIGFGAGCDALLLQATDRLPDFQASATVASALANGRPDGHYLRLLSFAGELQMEWGMRAENDSKTALSQQYRASEQLSGFVGGKCGACGAVQFPVLATCVNCGGMGGMEPVPLADEPARVATFTADWLQYYPSPPMYFGLVQFDNGARVLMEMVDVDPDVLTVGSKLRMVFRVKEIDRLRHYRRYFWKAAPIPLKQD